MVITKDKAQNTGLKAKANITVTIRAIVIIVAEAMYLKNAQYMVKLAILVIRKGITSSVVDPGNEASVVQDVGLILTKGSPDMTSMK